MGTDTGIITSNIYDGEIHERLNPLVEKITGVLFRKIEFDEESFNVLNRCVADRKNIVYASFHSSNISLLILYNLLKRRGFQPPVFALEYNPFLLQRTVFVWKRVVKFFKEVILRREYKYILDTGHIQELIQGRKSILLSLMSRRYFLKRYTDFKYDSLVYLIEVQKTAESPIYLLPQMIFWNRNPERTVPRGIIGTTPREIVSSRATGDKSLISGWLAVLKSMTPAFVRLSAPLNLKEEIANSRSDDSRQIAIEVRNKLLGIYHHEKRTILGPVLKSRQEMMEKILYNKNVLEEIARLSAADGTPESVLRKRAYRYYREIAADYSVVYVSLFEKALDYIFRRIYDGISYDQEAIRQIREAAQRGPLVLAPCHKSHMDYLILSYILFKNKMFPPHIAAGINLSFFPMGTIFRHSGAFFLRRSFKGLKLYPVVFKQYIKTLISEGYTLEFFIEGGRTRTGKLVYPKLGFLSYLLEAIEEGYHKDLVFVPIAINYDRILEEQSYEHELKGGEKATESVTSMMESRKLLTRKYGRVYVTFNQPFSVSEIKEWGFKGSEIPPVIAETVIKRINQVTVVTPFALTTTAMLLISVKGFSRQMLVERMKSIYDYLAHARVILSDSLKSAGNIDEIVDYVMAAYMEDKILEGLPMEGGKKKEMVKDFYVLRDNNRARIVFYKNSIIHYLLPLAFTSLALLRAHRDGEGGEPARAGIEFLKDVFSIEFLHFEGDDPELPAPPLVQEYLLANFCAKTDGGRLVLNEEKADDLRHFARIVQDYLESYAVVLQTLLAHKPKRSTHRELVTEIRRNGVRMYHTGDVRLSESLSQPNYQNALSKLIQAGMVNERQAGGRHAEVTGIDRDRVQELYGRLKSFLDVLA
jgi:glycerol-3-phosphate O-acyltransferase